MKKIKSILIILLAMSLMLGVTACDKQGAPQAEDTYTEPDVEIDTAPTQPNETTPEAEAAVEKNGEIYILYTSDIHCGIDQGFGLAGLKQVRDNLEAQGYTTILVDDGDAIQGEAIGTVTKGENIVELMNDIGYDVAIPGNHEFDYGVDRFIELTELAEHPYICCNFTYMDEPVFAPYVIIEAAGQKIAFVGVTTPKTFNSVTPAFFQNEDGEYVYGFMQDESGESVYNAVQSAVDSARAEGAELVYVMGHMGFEEACRPWTYADIIENTNGIDVFLDGHSHDTEQVVMKNKDGEDVTRTASGTKLKNIGYSHISAEGEVLETGIWSWPNSVSAPELFGIENEMTAKVEESVSELADQLDRVVAQSNYQLTIYDPTAVDESGSPIRIVRCMETNMGDLCADAFRDQSGADVAIVNGGGIRTSIEKGDITYGDIIKIYPHGNMLCAVKATGQQILDALEWGSRNVPSQLGGFLQVSGLTYEIDVSVESGCVEGENGIMVSIDGERRVKNVLIGGEPIDPEKTYTVAGTDYILLNHGDGYTAFDGDEVVLDGAKLDNQVLIDYIVDTLGGVIGAEYAEPYGQGRITIIGTEE